MILVLSLGKLFVIRQTIGNQILQAFCHGRSVDFYEHLAAFEGNNYLKKTVGNSLQSVSLIGPQICLLLEMVIYVTLHKNNTSHNDKMKGSLNSNQLHARYR